MARTPLDFQSINEHASSCSEHIIESLVPGGQWKGREYTVLNPTRDDNKAGSFKINRDIVFSDFKTGDSGSGAISLASYVLQCDSYTAAKRVSEIIGSAENFEQEKKTRRKTSEKNWTHISPIPKSAPKIPTKFKLGTPDNIYTYRDTKGRPIGYILRFNRKGGKDILPLIYTDHGWKMKQFPVPRPLYGLEQLTTCKRLIVVEGEKCADALRKKIKSWGVITWPGGSKAIDKCDWSLIRGYKIILWPDADEPGRCGMGLLYRILTPSNEVKMVNTEMFNGGYDAYDLISDGKNPMSFLKDNIVEPEQEQEQEQEPLIEDEQAPDYDDIFDGAPFRFLGYDSTHLYFLPYRALQVLELNALHISYNALIMLAPANWWEKRFPFNNGGGVNTKAAVNALISRSFETGVYDCRRLRGAGAWFDRGRVVLHVGSELIVDGDRTAIREFDTVYTYERSTTQHITNDKTLPKKEAYKLQEISDRLQWSKPVYAKLFAGWCVVAPICGALSWRPHIWVTGGAGTGKSWTIENIVRPLLGQFSMLVQSNTTEAGIRQGLGNHAFPIIFDEAEGEDRAAQNRIQAVLELMRQASSESGSEIVKGSSHGRALKFRVRSCFCLSSIGVNINQSADQGRISVLSLIRNNSANALEEFESIKSDVTRLLSRDYTASFRARSISLIPVIRKNADTFSRVIASRFASKRAGDQIGALLAGAYSLTSNGEIDIDDATRYVDSQDWAEQVPDDEETDEARLLSYILQSIVSVTTGNGRIDRTVAQLVGKCKGLRDVRETDIEDTGMFTTDIEEKHANGTLLSLGMKAEEDYLFVSNNHKGVRGLLADSPWSRSWHRILERLDGSEKRVVRYQPGVQTRSVGIPYDYIFED